MLRGAQAISLDAIISVMTLVHSRVAVKPITLQAELVFTTRAEAFEVDVRTKVVSVWNIGIKPATTTESDQTLLTTVTKNFFAISLWLAGETSRGEDRFFS